MVKIRRSLSAALIGLGLLLTVPPTDAAPPFQPGEKLTYHFHWGLFMVGRGTFEVGEPDADGNSRFIVRVHSNNLISTIYPVEDVLTSFFDPVRKQAVHFLQERSEGRHKVWEETFFFYSFKQGLTTSYISGERKWFDIPGGGIQDKLSTIYYMRTLDWKDREEAKIVIGNDKGNHEVTMRKIAREQLKMDDFAPIPTFKVEPNSEYMSGFVKKGKMTVWVSEDAWHVPIRVVSKLPVGSIRADLVKVEGIPDWPYELKN